MKRFQRALEPAGFDEGCRQPGLAWLRANPSPKRPRDFWSPFKTRLCDAFGQLCGYSCMFEPVGTVDHYLSCHVRRERAYEWDNFRFASQWINSSKRTADDEVLDPFEVEDGWFEILLPSLQLVLTDRVPPEHRARAEHTLRRLHLRDDVRVIRQRAEWYRMYEEGELNLEGLRRKAPLIADAIERQGGVPSSLTRP
jgi:hypothetical protein